MAKEFKLPDLGEGIHEAQVVNVMIEQGQTVTEDQMVMEVETDKASVELPVPYAGVVTELNVEVGATVCVGDVLLVVADSADQGAAKAAKRPQASSAPAEAVAAGAPGVPTEATIAAQHAATVARAPAHAVGPVPAAPAVRRMAREQGIDLRQVHGTGPGGRIVREDVERFQIAGPTGSGHALSPPAPVVPAAPARRVPALAEPPPTTTGILAEPLPDFSQWGPIRREKIPQIRKAIARQMTRAWTTIPHVTHGDEADITDLDGFRREHGEVMVDKGVKLTLTAFLMKAAAGALRQFPALNSSFDEGASELIFKDYVHIGVAVDTPRGLMVPVFRDVDRKGLMALSKELKEVAERARDFKLGIEDMRGGTFTLTNVGALGGTFSTPMINYPEVAILGMGRMTLKPVVRNGEIVQRKMLPLFLSFDHRVIDGADGARFVKTIINFLENPLNLLLAS